MGSSPIGSTRFKSFLAILLIFSQFTATFSYSFDDRAYDSALRAQVLQQSAATAPPTPMSTQDSAQAAGSSNGSGGSGSASGTGGGAVADTTTNTSTSRTIETGGGSDNSTLIVGGVAVAAIAAYLLLKGDSKDMPPEMAAQAKQACAQNPALATQLNNTEVVGQANREMRENNVPKAIEALAPKLANDITVDNPALIDDTGKPKPQEWDQKFREITKVFEPKDNLEQDETAKQDKCSELSLARSECETLLKTLTEKRQQAISQDGEAATSLGNALKDAKGPQPSTGNNGVPEIQSRLCLADAGYKSAIQAYQNAAAAYETAAKEIRTEKGRFDQTLGKYTPVTQTQPTDIPVTETGAVGEVPGDKGLVAAREEIKTRLKVKSEVMSANKKPDIDNAKLSVQKGTAELIVKRAEFESAVGRLYSDYTEVQAGVLDGRATQRKASLAKAQANLVNLDATMQTYDATRTDDYISAYGAPGTPLIVPSWDETSIFNDKSGLKEKLDSTKQKFFVLDKATCTLHEYCG